MGKCTVKMPDDFLMKISRLGSRTDEIVPKVLDAGAEVVERKARSNLKAVIGSGTKYPSRSTGQLISALGVSPAKQDRDGNFNVKIGFDEKRPDGVSNAMLAGVLEYGKHNQTAKPFMAPARSQSKKACIRAMDEKLDSEVAKL